MNFIEKLMDLRRVIVTALLPQNCFSRFRQKIQIILPVLSRHMIELLERHRLRPTCKQQGGGCQQNRCGVAEADMIEHGFLLVV
jgi:hypothetical protein